MQYTYLAGVVAVGIAVYFAFALLFKVEEVSYVKDIILKKFKKG